MRGIERERKRWRDSKCSTGRELISFNTCTYGNIRIIIYLINVVSSAQVGRCMNAGGCARRVGVLVCIHVCL